MGVLLWAIRIDGQGDDHTRVLLHTKVDWENLMKLAQSHLLVSFLYHRLYNLPDRELGAKIDFYFKEYYRANIRRNLIHSRQLLWILQILSKKGIQAIPFKGVVLALQAYGTTDLRQCGDVDILIHKENLPEIIIIFKGIGFHSKIPFKNNNSPKLMHIIKGNDTFSRTTKSDFPLKTKSIFSRSSFRVVL